jgi:hypothetical protein
MDPDSPLYRGISLSIRDFLDLVSGSTEPVWLSSFWSCTTERDIAHAFATINKDPEHPVPVLLIIHTIRPPPEITFSRHPNEHERILDPMNQIMILNWAFQPDLGCFIVRAVLQRRDHSDA